MRAFSPWSPDPATSPFSSKGVQPKTGRMPHLLPPQPHHQNIHLFLSRFTERIRHVVASMPPKPSPTETPDPETLQTCSYSTYQGRSGFSLPPSPCPRTFTHARTLMQERHSETRRQKRRDLTPGWVGIAQLTEHGGFPSRGLEKGGGEMAAWCETRRMREKKEEEERIEEELGRSEGK